MASARARLPRRRRVKGQALSRDGGPPQRRGFFFSSPPTASDRAGASRKWAGPLGRTSSDRAADWQGADSTPRPLEGRDWPGLREGGAAPVTWCALFSRHVAAAGKGRPLRLGSGDLPPWNERPLISSLLYQRGLHELGAGARPPARRRGESGPAPSGLEAFAELRQPNRRSSLSQVSF